MVRPRVVGSRACWVKKRIEGKGSQSRICLTLWHGKKPHSLFLRLLPTIKLVHPNHRERERERVIIKYETLVWVFGGSHSFLFFRLILLFFLLLLRFFFGFWLKSLGFFFGSWRMYIASMRRSFKDSLKVLEADIQHANTLSVSLSTPFSFFHHIHYSFHTRFLFLIIKF